MTGNPLILHPAETLDPRLTIDDHALAIASRNAFPVVAARAARKDDMGLAIGGAIALLIGGITFWSMSAHRAAPLARPQVPAPAQPAVPARKLPVVATPLPAPIAQPVAQTVGQTMPGPDHLHSPIMVFDASPIPAPATSAGPVAGPAPSRTGGQLSENEAFAARVGDGGVETASATRMADPANTVSQGTLIAAVLETAIDSDLPGYVRAIVSQDVRSFDGSRILIPRSSRLIGQYKSGLAAGQTRAYVLWTRLLRPDGVSIALGSPATDFSGRSGLTGDVDGHFGKRFGSAMLLSVVGGLSAIGTGGASLIVSGGQSAASVAAQRDAQIPPTIRIRQGQPIRIFTARDLDFSTIAADPVP